MKRMLTPLLSVAVALVAGCGIGPHVDDYTDALVASAVASCACGGLTYSSEEECRAEFPPDGGDQACLEALFKNADGDFEGHLDCRAAAHNRAAACANAKTCTDLARLGCLTQLVDELEDCPALPAEIQRDHDECLN